jgi:tyrosinase
MIELGTISRRTLLKQGAATAIAFAGSGVAAGRVVAQSPSPSVSAPAGLRVRPNAATLSSAQKAAYVNAILALKQQPSPWIQGLSTYDTFVLWHRDAFDCGLNAAHMGAAFLPWHRQYLKLFEEQLQAVDPTVSLAYWDWTVDDAPDSYLWQDDFMGGNGDPDQGEAVVTGPFAKGSWEILVFDHGDRDRFPYITRDLGASALAPTLPTAADVEAALEVGTYDSAPWNATAPIASSFRNTLEGWRDCVEQSCSEVDGVGPTCTGGHELHNRVHLWVSGEFAFAHELRGGHVMASPGASPDASPGATPGASPAALPDTEDVFGTMASNSSPNDPVFFLHHANIDRLWSVWMDRHGMSYEPVSGGPVGHNIDDPMWPYTQLGLTITPRMMLDSRALGYVYDSDAV